VGVTSFRTERLHVRRAAPGDEEIVQAVLDGAPGYHELVDGAPAEARAGADLLADADADSDRLLLLLWPGAGGPAVGLIDLQLHWPDPGAAHVRLLLLREAQHGRGLGREATRGLEEALRGQGFRALRLSVTGENAGARAFWERIGFAPVEWLEAGDTLHEKIL
jgi:ribosomal protein S18 acetylase RimI-like enzyme